VNKEKEKEPKKGKEKEAAKEGPKVKAEPPRLRLRYFSEVVPALQKRFNFKNVMQVPRLDKIVVNIGVGKATTEPKLVDEAVACLRDITGQKPVVTKAKKAISNFKLRQNLPIGCKVTLRGSHMYEFMDRLVAIAIPRIRDFRGLSRKCFDGHGNYTLGIKEQVVFMEIDRDKVSRVSGMDICICTTAETDELALGLLEEIGMPFRKS
jgi:large subunit ribosomal protein L5